MWMSRGHRDYSLCICISIVVHNYTVLLYVCQVPQTRDRELTICAKLLYSKILTFNPFFTQQVRGRDAIEICSYQ